MATTAANPDPMSQTDAATEVNPGLGQPVETTSIAGQTSSATALTSASTRIEEPVAQRRLPLLGRLPVTRQIQVLSGVLVACLVAAAAIAWFYARTADHIAQSISTSTTMQMLSQRMAKAAQQAVLGEPDGFAQLRETRDRFAADLQRLTRGDADLPAASGAAAGTLAEIDARWQPVRADVELILAQQGNLVDLRANEAAIADAAPRIERLTQQLAALAGSESEAYRVRTLALQLEYDARNYRFAEAVRLLSTDQPNPRVALQLGRNVAGFGDQLSTLLGGAGARAGEAVRGSEARRAAELLLGQFTPFAASVEGILANMTDLAAAKQASRDIFAASEPLLQLPGVLAAIFAAQSTRQFAVAMVGAALGVLALVCVALIAKVYLEDARARAAQSDRDYRRNQEAIIRLLDEMQGLAEGNLTIQARVTDDITGAIADSVNFAVEELRDLVEGINVATALLGSATEETREISTRVLRAAGRQTVEIRNTTGSVLDMARSIKKVSERADECVAVARHSLAASEKGASAVQASISGMNAIREQIQETAKRIKRLGENSQEIGEIVELIADITEQTNVLALNAAIQAASAGAAGRGFSVVAEEVQRLAERSAEATQQIAGIVKTIQTDTQDTVLAMEKSTQGVVEGTRVSDAAGRGLAEIGAVSRKLAKMIQGIAQQTGTQAVGAQGVARSMHGILKITEQTAAGTRRTTASMEKVSELTSGLAESVSGFRT